jgi:hypothetical protein
MGLLMAGLVAESHTWLAVLLTVLGIAMGFTAVVLKPALDNTAIYRSE